MLQSSGSESKRSVMLSNEENQMVFNLLGHNCMSLSTSVIERYETTAPNHRAWVKRDVGVLCFVKDNSRRNYFFRMYCIANMKMIWEQEVYSKMEYIMPASFMHTFEGNECMIAFNFSNEDEAKHMKDIVSHKIDFKTKREARRQRAQNASQKSLVPSNPTTYPTNTIENSFPSRMKMSKDQKRKRNITKADIGKPQDFKHLSHIGWNKDTGMQFRTKDEALTELITKAGISENQMQDPATRNFIYDFINTHDTNLIIKDEQVVKGRRPSPAIPVNNAPVPPSPSSAVVAAASSTPGPAGPPVPPRSGSKPTPNRAAPPPPPSVTHAPLEHNNTNVRNNVPPPRPPTGPRAVPSIPKAAMPPPPPVNAPAPPPPPSLPPVTPISPPPPMPPMMPSSMAEQSTPDGRSALLDSIRSGTTLKPVAQAPDNHEKAKPDDARGDLLSEIRKGFQLKPCNEREVKPISPAADAQQNGVNDLAAALSRALAERNRVIHPDDDDDDDSSDSNDDEWD